MSRQARRGSACTRRADAAPLAFLLPDLGSGGPWRRACNHAAPKPSMGSRPCERRAGSAIVPSGRQCQAQSPFQLLERAPDGPHANDQHLRDMGRGLPGQVALQDVTFL
jgi:hypothetical protein